MRIVFIGAGEISVLTAQILIKRGHDVILIEKERKRIDELSDELDCSFLHGDGGKPAILRQADSEATDVLFCLTNNDQANILSSLVGRSMGFRRVITSIQDVDLEGLCAELGLEHTIIPSQTISRSLADMVFRDEAIELSTVLKGESRIFTFCVPEQDAGPLDNLQLPESSRVVWYYRGDDQLKYPDSDTTLQQGDEVVLITPSTHVAELHQRWKPKHDRQERDDSADRADS